MGILLSRRWERFLQQMREFITQYEQQIEHLMRLLERTMGPLKPSRDIHSPTLLYDLAPGLRHRFTSPAELAESRKLAMPRTPYPLGPRSHFKPQELCRTPPHFSKTSTPARTPLRTTRITVSPAPFSYVPIRKP